MPAAQPAFTALMPWAAWLVLLLLAISGLSAAPAARAQDPIDAWFEDFKASASPEELYRFLYAMPKGGDLHIHMAGSVLSEWYYDEAIAQSANGYAYWTRTKLLGCRPYGGDEFSDTPYLMFFHTIQGSSYDALSDCEKAEYTRLADLSATEKTAWLDSIRLDKPYEGREEFFERHWDRLGDLLHNPHLMANVLVRHMRAMADEGMIYTEPQLSVFGHIDPTGAVIRPDDVANIYRARLAEADAQATGMEVKLQLTVLRFGAFAEQSARDSYAFVSQNRDLYAAVNMAGREDNDKGHPGRFRDVFNEMRVAHPGVKLSIHAGEVDEPNAHMSDTLLLGADRIGHGLNLVTDDDTLLRFRHGPYMIEINLISNLLLEYIDDYADHPFPQYLRMGIPVALSTDDRGMWDSNMTDEFFVAVTQFNLTWAEIKRLSRTSLRHAFVEPDKRTAMLNTYNERIAAFEQLAQAEPGLVLARDAVSYGFTCRRYGLCDWEQ